MTNKVKITERGWAGHLIFADKCKFRRNTLLEYGDKKWVVSTVGQYVYNNKSETIGAGRYYETMAFEAYRDRAYWDANIEKDIEFDSNWAIDHLDYDSDLEANEMHEAVVKELSIKIKKD